MKLFVVGSECRHKIYLSLDASARSDVPLWFNAKCPIDGKEYSFTSTEVTAEPDVGATIGGAALGGLVGALGGPIGIVLGGLLGALVGGSSESQDAEKARRFNTS
jgi:hypothetical protein